MEEVECWAVEICTFSHNKLHPFFPPRFKQLGHLLPAIDGTKKQPKKNRWPQMPSAKAQQRERDRQKEKEILNDLQTVWKELDDVEGKQEESEKKEGEMEQKEENEKKKDNNEKKENEEKKEMGQKEENEEKKEQMEQ